jgi:hypothetical protein
MVVEQGKKIAPHEQPWSTMVSIASYPSLLGSPVMRSMAMCEKGLALMVDGIRNIRVFDPGARPKVFSIDASDCFVSSGMAVDRTFMPDVH